MVTIQHPLALLLLAPVIPILVIAWRGNFLHLGPLRNQIVLVVRLVLVISLIFGLAGVTRSAAKTREAVVFLADLSASNAPNRTQMQGLIDGALRLRPRDSQAAVVVTGKNALVDEPMSSQTGFPGFGSIVNPDFTNLESGLELAGALLPAGYRKRIVILSDGNQNTGDAMQAAQVLRAQGVRLDVVHERGVQGRDARVVGITVPSQLHQGERFDVKSRVFATSATPARLDLYRDRQLLASKAVHLLPGTNSYHFPQKSLRSGLHSFEVRLAVTHDSIPQNNSASASTVVQGPARVLVISASRASTVNVVSSLSAAGISEEVRKPDQVVPTLSTLQRFAAIVIVDTAAVDLGAQLLNQIVPYVRDLGRGLVVVGGEQSFSLGGYGGTPLEQALPVKMDLPKRKDLSSAAVSLIVESLEAPQAINISKEAAKGAIKLLTQQDQVGVNNTPNDGSSGVVVPLQHPIDKAAINRAVESMLPGDPGSYYDYLESAYQDLRHASARIKHIILLGDGDSADSRYAALVRKIRSAGITISTVITNGQSANDFATMRAIARLGGGRFYQADNPSAVPKIFVHETHSIAHSGVVAGRFFPRIVSPNPMVRALVGVPALTGYVATVPKSAGEVVLSSRKSDPVLAAWQFGLGRSVVWTSDAAGLWTHDWLASETTKSLWARMVSWVLPAGNRNGLFLSVTPANGQARVSVSVPDSLGAALSVSAHILNPNLKSTSVVLEPVGNGTYQAAFDTPSQGSYLVTVQAHGDRGAATGEAGIDVPYSAEFNGLGSNPRFLNDLARTGGGSTIQSPDQVWANNVPAVSGTESMSNLLWLLSLLLLPVDVGLRRLVFRRRQRAAIFSKATARSFNVRSLQRPVRPAGPHKPSSASRSERRPLKTFAHAGNVGATELTSPAPPIARSGADTTVGKLLAAKRRRESV